MEREETHIKNKPNRKISTTKVEKAGGDTERGLKSNWDEGMPAGKVKGTCGA